MAKKHRKRVLPVPEDSPREISAPESRREYFLPILALLGLWILLEALVNPRGEFPLNDDWCYARSAFMFATKHKLMLMDIVPMTLATQVIWGAAFCKILGMSFTALRLSTVVLGFIGLVATYALLREAKASRWIAFTGCAVVALNPLYFPLANTFMTDVPFSAFVLVSLYFYMLALKRDSVRWVIAGTLVACAATLMRQLGVILPAAFMVACLVKDGARVRSLLKGLAPIIITVAVLLAYQQWLKATGRMTSYYSLQTKMYGDFLRAGIPFMLAGLAEVVRNAYVYLGVFLLPYLILAVPRKWKALSPRLRIVNPAIALLSLIAVMDFMMRNDEWMPLKKKSGDMIVDFGIGPSLLTDVFCLGLPNLINAPMWLWQLVSVAGVLGGALLTLHILLAVEGLWSRKSGVPAFERGFIALILGATVLYLAPSVPLTAFIYFDRYFVCAVPLLLILIVLTSGTLARPNRVLLSVSLAVMLLIGAFAVGAEHDYLAWNRTRWQALNDLMHKEGVPANCIDGGYEFNGWYHYQGAKQHWWRVIRDDYMVTFGPVPGFDEIKRYPYQRWMPREEAYIYVLANMGSSPAQ